MQPNMLSSANHRFRQLGMVAMLLLVSFLLGACATPDQTTTPTEEATTDALLDEPTDDLMMAEPTDDTMLDEPTDDLMVTEPTDDTMLDEPTDALDATPGAALDEEISLSDIEDNSEVYIGQTVTVTGEVSTLISPRAFLMNENNLLELGDEMLVVYAQDPSQINLTEDTRIRITGTVTNFVQVDTESWYNIDLEDELFTEYEDRLAIIADTIDVVATVSDLVEQPEAYLGNIVTVSGDVTEVIGAQLFRLNDPAFLDNDSLLVVTNSPDVVVSEGDSVQVSGTIAQFDVGMIEQQAADVENLSERLGEMTDQVMLQAQSVEVEAVEE